VNRTTAHTRRVGLTSRWPLLTAAVAFLLTVSACSTTSDGAQAGAVNKGDVPAEVSQRVEKATAVPKLTSPGDAVNVSALAGKKVFVIPLFSTNQYNQQIDSAMESAGELSKISVKVFDNQGQVNQWVSGIGQAISEKYDVIVLSGGIDPRVLLPQIDEAQKSGIKVISSQFFDDSVQSADKCGNTVTLDCAGSIDGVVTAPYRLSAQLDADWIINDSDVNAHTLVLTSNDVGPNAYQVDAIKGEFAAQCPKCEQTFVNIPSTEWTTSVQSSVQSALNKDPSINYIIPVYDVMANDASTAVSVVGRLGKVKIATFNGTPAVLQLIEKGDTVGLNVGQSLAQIGYANMDQAFRILSGNHPSAAARDVVRAFQKSNVADAGTPPKANEGFGPGYLNDYKALWGLS